MVKTPKPRSSTPAAVRQGADDVIKYRRDDQLGIALAQGRIAAG
jgi:hypothetical protein